MNTARRALHSLIVLLLLTLPGQATETEDVAWSIDWRPGPTEQLSFETEEGSWMGVDLHPSGDRFLFDLLGDIYELPAQGGTALRLTSGPAWDSEARYSPDGATIVFTSDRSNNRNLWLMDADGGRPRALTSETDSRVSDAAWTPDGDSIVARRRFTDTSSIGVQELWLYHRLGGSGVQLTKREERGGASEPALSPDGRYVFFSSRSGRYSYGRDPNRGIWQVQRMDRLTGQTRPLTGEYGGAVRPSPSPDGSRLAVVRRIRSSTTLEILDLASGHLQRIGDWLDRDEQEGFAVNGLYPRMDWFPDGRSLLVYAGGGFWKVDASTGERSRIPFSASVELDLVDAVRPERSAVEEAVSARLIRWPVLSPDGEVLVFGALGSLWRMDLPDGTPTRLTGDSVREYGPAWSPDGKWIAYVGWSDAEGGSVRLVSRRGGRSRVVTRASAKYSNPSFSPDGRELVLLRGSGAHRRSGELGSELWSDVVTLNPATGEQRVVTQTMGLKRAARPRFSADGRRVLVPESKSVDRAAAKGVLISVNRDGTDRREILQVGAAEDIVPSPDGRWVAFKEDHHAWVALVPEAGKGPFAVQKQGGGAPAWRLSEVAGDWVDFTADGRFVTWGHGPAVHRLELSELLRWEQERQDEALLEAASKEGDQDDEDPGDGPEDAPLPEGEESGEDAAVEAEGTEEGADSDDEEAVVPPSERFAIDLQVPRAVPAGSVAITGARIVTMRGDEVLEGATILTRNDRIAAIGPDGSVDLDPDTHVVDGAGTTIIPGLIDVHAHMHFSALDVMPEQDWRYYVNLAYGVTTIHDPSVFTDQVFTFAEQVEAGRMVGPRVFSTGQILYGASGSFRSDIQSLDDARRHVQRLKDLGAISVKSYQQPRRDQRQWLVQACRELGMLDIPEGGGDTAGNLTMVLDGHSAIEHALPTVPLYDDIVRVFAASETFYSPTLLVAYGGAPGEHWFFANDRVWDDERLATFTPQYVLDSRSRRLTLVAPDDDWHHQEVARQAARIQDAGGHVTLGAHGQLQGLGVHWELWALGGPGAMEPLEALRSATLEGARYLGMEASLGSLEPGKLADFVVLERNPLEAIENSDSVRSVVKNGVLYDAATMDRLWPAPARRAPFVWEQAAGIEPAHAVE